MVYEFLNKSPQFDDSVFVAPSADIIGDVTFGSECSVWFNVTIRGDVNWIEIGERTNIQDNSSVHVTNQTFPTSIGNDVTIGHNSMVHGCTIHDRVLIGIQSTVLDGAVIHSDVILAAGSLVPPGKELESGFLYMGSPAKKARRLSDKEIQSIKDNAANYIKYQRAYKRVDTYDTNPFYKAK
jgi:carbonic anhydrase/acetyltransferase-like protein (isoleucine patch superfamily)